MAEATKKSAPNARARATQKGALAATTSGKAPPRKRATPAATKASARRPVATKTPAARAAPEGIAKIPSQRKSPTAKAPVPIPDALPVSTSGGDCFFCGAAQATVAELKDHLTRDHALGPTATPMVESPPVAQGAVSVPPVWIPTSESAAAQRNRRKRAVVLAVALVAGLVVAIAIAVSVGGSGVRQGFNNPDRLAADIMLTVNEKMSAKGLSETLTDVTCIKAGTPHTFTCNATASDGSTATVHATVSANGDTWITDSG